MVHLSVDDYFMSIARMESQFSKDPKLKVGACIVDTDNNIVAQGHNCMPRGCDDLTWEKTFKGNSTDLKYHYVYYAIPDAFTKSATSDITGSIVYTTLFPSNKCAMMLMEAGVKRVVYQLDKKNDEDETKASRFMLEQTTIKLDQLIHDGKKTETYCMAMAVRTAQFSNFEKKTGACIVDANNEIVSVGHNRWPRGLTHLKNSPVEDEDLYVCSPTRIAYSSAGRPTIEGGKIYLTEFPDHESAKIIIQSGITEIIYKPGHEENSSLYEKTIVLLRKANIKYRKFLEIVKVDIDETHSFEM